ncbi:MAG: Gfo/Idh/MocA family protein [Pyrinomonadaceae bacterium]
MSDTPPLRWGLIGCGDIACRRVAPAFSALPDCELVAVGRARRELAEAFAGEFGARRWYADWRELVADEEVEAVYVATPVHLHAEQSIAAAEAGKHVLCEKPMAMSIAECDQVLAACAAKGVRLGVAYYRHFYPVVERIKAILGAGEIGRAVVAQVNAFERFNPEPTHPRRWLVEKRLSGGGPMFDFGSHRIEVLLNLFGRVKEIRGLSGNQLFEREVEDTASALLQFDGGPQATLSVTHAAREPQDTLHIFGSAGSIHVPVLNEGTIRIATGAGERVETLPPHANTHQPLVEDFVRAVRRGRDPRVGGLIGREVARVEEEIYGDAGD